MQKTIDSLQNRLPLTLFVVLQIIFVYLLYIKPVPVFVIIGVIALLSTTIFNTRRLFLLLLVILLVIPYHGYNYPPFNFSINIKIVYVTLLIIIGYFILDLTMNPRIVCKTRMNLPILIILVSIFTNTLIGIMNGNKGEFILSDLLVLSLYGFYFIIPTLINKKETLFTILRIFVICTAIIAAEYFLIFFYHLSRGEFVRINPNQGQIFIFSLPLLIGIIIKKRNSKITNVLLLSLIAASLAALGISLTRGLWISTTIAILTMLFLFRKEINKKVLLGGLIFIISGFVVILAYFTLVTGLDTLALILSRAETFLELGQIASVQQRILTNQRVLEHILRNIVLGAGLGGHIVYSHLRAVYYVFWIDNSYLMLLWKLGIAGAIAYVWIIIKSLTTSIRIFKSTKNATIKVFTGAIISFIIAFSILGISTPIMLKYALNIVWILLIALLDSIQNITHSGKKLSDVSNGVFA